MLERCVAGQGRAPGLAVGIIDDSGARLFCKGTLEKGAGGEVNGETVFEIGSITKVFTALLLEEMAESGEVKLDDPIGKYLPASVKTPARQGRQITLVESGDADFGPAAAAGQSGAEGQRQSVRRLHGGAVV